MAFASGHPHRARRQVDHGPPVQQQLGQYDAQAGLLVTMAMAVAVGFGAATTQKVLEVVYAHTRPVEGTGQPYRHEHLSHEPVSERMGRSAGVLSRR